MIAVTRLDGTPMLLNDDLIETIEATPDTLIALTTGDKLFVRESPDAVVDRIVGFRQRLLGARDGRRSAPVGAGTEGDR